LVAARRRLVHHLLPFTRKRRANPKHSDTRASRSSMEFSAVIRAFFIEIGSVNLCPVFLDNIKPYLLSVANP
jgi:hypothetical protein